MEISMDGTDPATWDPTQDAVVAVSYTHLDVYKRQPSRKAIASSSTLTASSIGMTGRASNTKAGSIEQNL